VGGRLGLGFTNETLSLLVKSTKMTWTPGTVPKDNLLGTGGNNSFSLCAPFTAAIRMTLSMRPPPLVIGFMLLSPTPYPVQ
jgi:hypothetical protein